MRSFLPLSTHSSSLRLLYMWMRHIFGKMQIAYRKGHKFAFMLWNVFFDWQKLQVIHGYDVGCLVITKCACFVYEDIIICFLSGCFCSHCHHHPSEIQSRSRFKLFFAGNNVPKNKKEEKWRRKIKPWAGIGPATSTYVGRGHAEEDLYLTKVTLYQARLL